MSAILAQLFQSQSTLVNRVTLWLYHSNIGSKWAVLRNIQNKVQSIILGLPKHVKSSELYTPWYRLRLYCFPASATENVVNALETVSLDARCGSRDH